MILHCLGDNSLEFGNDHDRTKRLLDCDHHLVGDVSENGRRKEQARSVQLAPTEHQLGALLHTDIAVLLQLLHVCAMVLWSVIGAAVQRVSDLHLLHLGNHALNELVVDRALHEQASGGDAVLAFVEENAVTRHPHRLFEVAVVEDDQW